MIRMLKVVMSLLVLSLGIFISVRDESQDALNSPVPESNISNYAPGDYRFNIFLKGKKREYVIHVPSKYNDGKPLPVVIMFHGGGGTAKGAMQETRWDRKAEREGFLAVFPEGTRPDSSRRARFSRNPQTWNDGSERGIGAVESRAADVEFFSVMLDDLKARFHVDNRRIYVTGFSNGASMSFRLARELPMVIAAAAPVAGADCLSHKMPDRAVPLIYITGTNDPLNPIEGGEIHIGRKSYGIKQPTKKMIANWVRLHNCLEEPRVVYEQNGERGVEYCHDVALYTLTGHGHHWPGGDSALGERLAGKNTAEINACDIIWDFFKRHSKV